MANHDHDEMSSAYCPVCGEKLRKQKLIKGLKEIIQETKNNHTTEILVRYHPRMHTKLGIAIENTDSQIEDPSTREINKYFDEAKFLKDGRKGVNKDFAITKKVGDYDLADTKHYTIQEVKDAA